MADIECPDCGFNQDDHNNPPAWNYTSSDEVECPECGEVNHVDDL